MLLQQVGGANVLSIEDFSSDSQVRGFISFHTDYIHSFLIAL